MSTGITMTETDRGPVMTLDAATAPETLDRLARMVRADGMPTTEPTPEQAETRRHLAAMVRPPLDDDFGEEDFLDSPEMARLGDQLIADWPELHHITQTRVSYSWKRKGGRKWGKILGGKCTPLSGYAKYRSQADFHIWLAADVLRDLAYGPAEIEAVLHHEHLHIGAVVDEDEDSPTFGEITIKGVNHDFEGFWSEIARYGAWKPELRSTEQEFRQLALVSDEAA